jgi:ankyrin repeat protein
VVLNLLINASSSDAEAAPDINIFDVVLADNLRAVEQHISADTDLNQKESFGGNTPLMLASLYGKAEVAKALMDAGCDLNLQNKAKGTALHQACFFSHPQIVEMLLSAGADTDKFNFTGLTPEGLIDRAFDEGWKAVYEHTHKTLDLDLDFDALLESRARIKQILRDLGSADN